MSTAFKVIGVLVMTFLTGGLFLIPWALYMILRKKPATPVQIEVSGETGKGSFEHYTYIKDKFLHDGCTKEHHNCDILGYSTAGRFLDKKLHPSASLKKELKSYIKKYQCQDSYDQVLREFSLN